MFFDTLSTNSVIIDHK